MRDRTVARLARILFALEAVLVVGMFVTVAVLAARGTDGIRDVGVDVVLTVAMFTFPVAGVVIARRQPRNAVAWVLLGVGAAAAVGAVTGVYDLVVRDVPWLVATRPYVATIKDWLWLPLLGPIGTFLILLFPDGHLPTPRWRGWAWFCGLALVVPSVLILLSPGPVGPEGTMTNPMGIAAFGEDFAIARFAVLAIPIAITGCAVALVRRYRRSRGIQRLQLKWLAFAASIMATGYLATMILSIPYDWTTESTPTWLNVLQAVSLFTFVLLPIAVGIAIMRYRLYDIDRLINRAVVYGVVSAFLILVYVGGVFAVGSLVRTVSGQEQNNLAVAASTLAVAALFRPVRARVRTFIDRRFYRRKYDALRIVESFSARLRQETDLQSLSDDLRAVVAETVQPAAVSLWFALRD